MSILINKKWGDLPCRNRIIEGIKTLYLKDEKKCNQILDNEGCYDIILEWLRTNKKGNPFETIPLCWEGPYSYNNSNTWVLLSEFVIEDGILFIGYHNYHSGPPDYGYMSLETVPDSVLAYALYLIKKGLAGCDIILPESLLLIRVDLRSISKNRLFARVCRHATDNTDMNTNVIFSTEEKVYSVISDQCKNHESVKRANYCWYYEGDSDGWMNFPDEFDHTWNALFIDMSNVPQEVTMILISFQEITADKIKCDRNAKLSITDQRLGINYVDNTMVVSKEESYRKSIKLVKMTDCWHISPVD